MSVGWTVARGSTLLILLACADSSAEGVFDGTYTLAQLNGSALPYDHNGLGCCTYLRGGLELNDGQYHAWITARNRNTTAVFTASERGTYGQDGTAITFMLVSYDVHPLRLGMGTAVGEVITLSIGGEGPGSPDQLDAVFEHRDDMAASVESLPDAILDRTR